MIRLRLLKSQGHRLSRNLKLVMEILVHSHCQMRIIKCSETWMTKFKEMQESDVSLQAL